MTFYERSHHIAFSRTDVLKLGPITLRGAGNHLTSDLSTLKMLCICTNVIIYVHKFFWAKNP